jgi:hypothetical protein
MRSWPASSSATLMTSHEASLTHLRRRGPALAALARTFSMMVMLWRHVVAVMAGRIGTPRQRLRHRRRCATMRCHR